MTVISTLITRYGTVHASDSLISEIQSDGTSKPIEWTKSKIIQVRRWWGIMSYFGLAKYDAYGWNTYKWLKKQAESAKEYSSAEKFAIAVKENLNVELMKIRLSKPVHKGIGIHFSAYEWIDGIWIPELFYLTNFKDTSYTAIHPDGIRLGRETYHTIVKVPSDLSHRKKRCRFVVHDHLQSKSNMLIYNNGDPVMFNTAAQSIVGMYRMIAERGSLKDSEDLKIYLEIARRPIKLVSEAQIYFCREDQRTIGGKPHDLGVIPGKDYYSTTGDNKP